MHSEVKRALVLNHKKKFLVLKKKKQSSKSAKSISYLLFIVFYILWKKQTKKKITNHKNVSSNWLYFSCKDLDFEFQNNLLLICDLKEILFTLNSISLSFVMRYFLCH